MVEDAYLAGGCFWGMQDLLRKLPGVMYSEVGYTGGWLEAPTYHDTHDSQSGHAEAVWVRFDPTVLTYADLLRWFFRMHDPTTKDRQGNDRGTQYRSALFPVNAAQSQTAAEVIDEVNRAGGWPAPVVTTIEPFARWWKAEEDHQDYLVRHPNGYTCHWIRD